MTKSIKIGEEDLLMFREANSNDYIIERIFLTNPILICEEKIFSARHDFYDGSSILLGRKHHKGSVVHGRGLILSLSREYMALSKN